MSISTVGNQLIHYEVLGRGQPVIFIHGWLGSWRYWWPSMQALSAARRSFAFDLWGFGDSSKVADNYSLEAYADMLEQFIERLGIQRPIMLVGHALGAVIALRFAKDHAEDVDKVVAVSLPLHGSLLHERLATTDPDAFVSRVLGKSNSFPEVDAELHKTDRAAMNQTAGELSELDFESDLKETLCPLLTIFGSQDSVIRPPRDERGLLQCADENRYTVSLDECGHFPMLQEKAKFNRLLLDFIHADENLTELAPKEYWRRRIR